MERKKEVSIIIIHWLFAVFVISMLSLGFYMKSTEYNLPTFQLHKSLGLTFFGLIFIRIYTTIKYPWQTSAIRPGSNNIAGKVHLALLALMIIVPTSGLLSSGFSGYSVHLFDFVIVPQNLDAAGNNVPFNAVVYGLSKGLHWVSAYALAALVFLHILAALKHHLINKDTVLVRMLGRGNRN